MALSSLSCLQGCAHQVHLQTCLPAILLYDCSSHRAVAVPPTDVPRLHPIPTQLVQQTLMPALIKVATEFSLNLWPIPLSEPVDLSCSPAPDGSRGRGTYLQLGRLTQAQITS